MADVDDVDDDADGGRDGEPDEVCGDDGAQKDADGDGAGESETPGTDRIRNHLGTASTHARFVKSALDVLLE
jgi:hypothetical protein